MKSSQKGLYGIKCIKSLMYLFVLSQSSVFNRLGGKTAVKRAASSTSPDDDDSDNDALEYAGIFKEVSSPKKAKVSIIRTLKKPKTTASLLAARKLVKKTISEFLP